MYHPINIPFGGVVLFNVVKLKEGVTLNDIELELGEMCNAVKESYGARRLQYSNCMHSDN